MAQPKKLVSELITDFELQVNDTTELSSTEELSLLNRIYIKICNLRPWAWLKVSATGSCSLDATGLYITIPTDFGMFIENNNYTDNSIESQNNAAPKVIFIGTNFTPYQIINWQDRRQYRTRTGFVYYDIANGIIRLTDPLTSLPVSRTFEFDYAKVAAKLIITDYPLFSGQFHDIITFGMAVDDFILQLSDKAKSYAVENQMKYQQLLADMEYQDAQTYLN